MVFTLPESTTLKVFGAILSRGPYSRCNLWIQSLDLDDRCVLALHKSVMAAMKGPGMCLNFQYWINVASSQYAATSSISSSSIIVKATYPNCLEAESREMSHMSDNLKLL